ncbi:uncharacterized protein LOC131436443 [Malaya genurostris]|uniref:uncharacterized protein LOC131436443 n=1 Tax=Malaya genurostris TaxID=325434 RepID=UPI0026F3BCDD|nr:uncharacterized protein LOC131436443 [Malaya genurostris]
MTNLYRLATVGLLVLFSLIQIDAAVDVAKLRSIRSVNPLVANIACDTGKRFGCADCSTVQVCQWDGTAIETSRYRCDSLNSSQPFCNGNSGECSAAPTGPCIKSSELCPAEGIYPNPTNCHEYIYCDAAKNAYAIPCASTDVYNHTEQDCVRSTSSNSCFAVNCATATSQNQWFSYTPTPKLYVFCSSTVGAMTFECTGTNVAFNAKTKKCEFSCPKSGRFAIPGEPTTSKRYYQCTLGSNNVLTYAIQECPNGLIFDTTTLKCITAPGGGGGGDI